MQLVAQGIRDNRDTEKVVALVVEDQGSVEAEVNEEEVTSIGR